MTTGRSIRLAIVLLPVLAVVSCIYLPIPPVDDLKLVSVDVVAQSNIPRRDKDWSDGEITEPLVRVTFSSNYDFQKLARQWSYYVGQTTAFCDSNANDPRNPLQGFPDIDDKFGRIDSYNFQHIDSGSGQSGPILYHVYFQLEQHGNVNWRAHDLVRDPQDICIRMNGHQEISGEIPTTRFRSNILVIPKREIVAAIERARLSKLP